MFVGVDLGGTNVRAAIEVDGVIHSPRRNAFNTTGSLEDTLRELIDFIRPSVQRGVNGIGIGVPSVVDVEEGIVYNVMNIPSWERVPLKRILEDAFSVPVRVNNDVNCFVLGEHRFGVLKGFRNVVGMACGTGLGLGVIINDALYVGNNCGAGEIGLLPYLGHTLEYYASGNFFPAFHGMSAVEAHERAKDDDPIALEAWSQFGEHFAQAIKNVVLTFDPEAVVLGGSVSKAYPFFVDSMKSALLDFPFGESMKRLKIFRSQNENAALLGAAALLRGKNGERAIA
ncbi:ROK family protein [Chryseolinea sp. T2]|uniref:ROK family protein n=1 Tax=Chryseolinea sp. T2 TaxID=3129255 RepID=UPI0030786893